MLPGSLLDSGGPCDRGLSGERSGVGQRALRDMVMNKNHNDDSYVSKIK